MYAVSDLGRRIRNVLRLQAVVDRQPRLSAIIGPERTRRGNCDEHPARIDGVEEDGVEAHAAGARLPLGPRAVLTKAGHFLPALAAIARSKQGGVLDTRVDGVRVGQRGFEVPDTRKLPRMWRAVVPLVRAGNA